MRPILFGMMFLLSFGFAQLRVSDHQRWAEFIIGKLGLIVEECVEGSESNWLCFDMPNDGDNDYVASRWSFYADLYSEEYGIRPRNAFRRTNNGNLSRDYCSVKGCLNVFLGKSIGIIDDYTFEMVLDNAATQANQPQPSQPPTSRTPQIGRPRFAFPNTAYVRLTELAAAMGGTVFATSQPQEYGFRAGNRVIFVTVGRIDAMDGNSQKLTLNAAPVIFENTLFISARSLSAIGCRVDGFDSIRGIALTCDEQTYYLSFKIWP
ncbi:MAG: stalk domain-containing protein [Meiothermus sp.]|nr:stalk domain-containing protein [Meiothermus sp.]